jgi:hypothetical protein
MLSSEDDVQKGLLKVGSFVRSITVLKLFLARPQLLLASYYFMVSSQAL